MKIAVFTDIFLDTTGGIVNSIKAQKKALEDAGHEVTVFCPGFSQPQDKTIVRVPTCKYFKPNAAPMAKNARKVRKFILTKCQNFHEFDVVHVHYEAGASIAGIRMAREFGLPLVQTMHGREDMAMEVNIPWVFHGMVSLVVNLAHGMYLPHTVRVKKDDYLAPTRARARMWTMMVNHANMADVVITPSEHFGKKLERYGVKVPRKVISNGIPDELVSDEVPVRKLGEGETLKIFWNSRISKEKRMLEFLEALKIVGPGVQLIAYGDGNVLNEAKEYARKNGLDVKFMGVGMQKKMLEKMRECHIGVTASYGFDTQAMTLLEAQATGLPVLFCDPDMRSIVPEGSYAMCEGPEPEKMARRIHEILAEPQQIEKMSMVMCKNHKKVAQTEVIRQLIDILAKVCYNEKRK